MSSFDEAGVTVISEDGVSVMSEDVVFIIDTLFYAPRTPSTEVHVDVVRTPTHSPVSKHEFETLAPCLGVAEILS